jgi:hypothetical protein
MDWAKDSTPLDGLFPGPVPAKEEDLVAAPGELSPGGRRRVYGALCLAARAAGRRTPARLRLLAEWRRRLDIADDDAALLETLADHLRCIRMGARQREKELTVAALVELVTVDGRTTRRERELVVRVAGRAGLDRVAAEDLISRGLDGRQPPRRLPAAPPRLEPAELDALFGPDEPAAPPARRFAGAGLFGASDVGEAAEAGSPELRSETGAIPTDGSSDTGAVDSDTGAVAPRRRGPPSDSGRLFASEEARAAVISGLRLLTDDFEPLG